MNLYKLLERLGKQKGVKEINEVIKIKNLGIKDETWALYQIGFIMETDHDYTLKAMTCSALVKHPGSGKKEEAFWSLGPPIEGMDGQGAPYADLVNHQAFKDMCGEVKQRFEKEFLCTIFGPYEDGTVRFQHILAHIEDGKLIMTDVKDYTK